MNDKTGPDIQSDTATEPQASRQDIPAAGSTSAEVNQQEKAKAEARQSANVGKNTDSEILGRVKTGERWMILLTAIVAGSAVFQTVQSCNNNASTSKQVDRLIYAADRIQQAAGNFSGSASDINGGISKAVGKLQNQADRTQEIAEASRNALISVQRAFVYPTPVMTPIYSFNKTTFEGTEISVRWDNSGVTPARAVSLHLSQQPMMGIPPGFDFPDGWDHGSPHVTSRNFIGPKGSISSSERITISPDEGRALAQSSAGIYVWGWAKYRDIFGKTRLHLTEYCYRIGATKTPLDPNGIRVAALVCSQHNCVDEECKDYKMQTDGK